MNLNELPTVQPDINKLKDELTSFCTQYSIAKFEAEDMVELLEDGEDVAWIVDQLQTENAEIDVDSLQALLTNIKTIVAPLAEEELEEEQELNETEQPAVDREMITELPDLSQLDLSQLELPPGMKLPPGVDMKQIQKLMESPQGKFMTDFTLFCQQKGVNMMGGALSDSQQMQELNEEWMATSREAFDGKTPAEMLSEDPLLMPQKIDTYRREEPRIGRNDPCPCGSGKKYKKCCGKGK